MMDENPVRPATDEELAAWHDWMTDEAGDLAPHAARILARIAALESAVRWCRPRLSKDVYRATLDGMVQLPPSPVHDEPKMVQS
jgi:hypothetical protein